MHDGHWEEIGIWRNLRPRDRDTRWERLRFLIASRSYFENRMGKGSTQVNETYARLLQVIDQEIERLGRMLQSEYAGLP